MHHRMQPQPVGGLIFRDPEDFSEQIKKIKKISEEIRTATMPEQIPIDKARELVERTLIATHNLADKAKDLTRDPTNFAVSAQIAKAANAVLDQTNKQVTQRLLFDIINPARKAGKKTVPSRLFGPNISLALMGIVRGYETLQEIDEAKPFILRNMPGTLSLIANIGRVVVFLGNLVGAASTALKQSVKDLSSGLDKLITILKWGSIAGGLYLLYGAIKPEKKKS